MPSGESEKTRGGKIELPRIWDNSRGGRVLPEFWENWSVNLLITKDVVEGRQASGAGCPEAKERRAKGSGDEVEGIVG
jgi:hypothetical protein